ncbi:c-type cytochrome [Altererythrobacter aestuarii]|uniref:C-type cytochrome n=2 Tax=Alteraurantiacibacter aestuarii TaxID=650004 RepID=A0A844ZJJ7_9SPHN|nr:c-type cytochrome [Alteraurantiacibacter aestuarii]
MPGRVIFARQCAPCHGTAPGDDGSPMLPGTAALTAKYEGRLPGLLELRSDLSAPVLNLFVRRGSGAMPMFRKAELSDADLAAIADYLAATARENASLAGH